MFNEDSLTKYIDSPREFLSFCFELGILQPSFRCSSCKKEMKLIKFKCSDGYIWRCSRYKCLYKTISIRKNSHFLKIKAPLLNIVRIIYKWTQMTPIKNIKHELKVGKSLIKTVINIFEPIIKKMSNRKIGGVDKIVEIDESCLTKMKYNVGRPLQRIWCIGGIERGSNKVFFTTSNLRDQSTLDKIITKYVTKGTTIYTDSWRGYNNLKNIGYNHEIVCHKENFLNPNNKEIHTQTIEITWRWLKKYLKTYPSIKKKNINFLIRQYFYLKAKKNDFKEILLDIRYKKPFN